MDHSNASLSPKTILCIPGNWKNSDEMANAVAVNNRDEFLFAIKILLNIKTNQPFEIEIYEKDDKMRESFRWAGMVNRVPDHFLDEIEAHELVVYLIGNSGSLESAKSVAAAGNAFLKAGGIGIKVETAGKAFTKDHWQELLQDSDEASLYEMFVIDSISDGNGTTYSCGMHNLGLKDCIIFNEDFRQAVEVISAFGYYQVIDQPVIKAGQNFSLGENEPVYTILEEKNQPNEYHELFENPFGMWRLDKHLENTLEPSISHQL